MVDTKLKYKDYWAYKEVTKNWKSDVKTDNDLFAEVVIWFDKKAKDVYARFEIEKYIVPECNISSYMVSLVYSDGDKIPINDSLEFTDTINECIESCFYYFHTRF